MSKPLLLARKPNKLPSVSHRQSYGLEYGQDALEIQAQIIPAQAQVLIIDDVVATGGTLLAAAELLRQAKIDIVGALSLLEIADLAGNSRLLKNGISAYSILSV
jgi:adenine phosphoribosyltransferase